MKIFGFLALVLLTGNIAQANVAEACADTARDKIIEQAASFEIKIDLSTFRLTQVDRNIYAWWSVDVTDINGRTDVFPEGTPHVLSKMVQYSGGTCY